MTIPNFNNKNDLFRFLKENKALLISQKKSTMKQADAVCYLAPISNSNDEVIKFAPVVEDDYREIKASLVINTTNLMDSHGDVHLPGLWNKSIKENRNVYLLQEHQMQFDKVISDNVKASTKNYTFQQLGYPEYQGLTQALIFDVTINKDRNPFMFDQYSKGYVKQHSVGMQYVNLSLAVNSTDELYKEEKAVWDKNINQIANKADAEAQGYFWAVSEAKMVEGSAVLKGSNFVTPVLEMTQSKNEPSDDTQNIEPDKTTQKVNYTYLLTNLKNK